MVKTKHALSQRKLAAEILKCGVHRVFIEPEFFDEVQMAISREDIRGLIKQGIIRKKNKKGISNVRVKLKQERKKKGRARGLGKRKGTAGARTPSKRKWINTIRPQRRALKELRDNGRIDRSIYRKIYLRAKGGSFRSTADMYRHLEEEKLLKK